MLCSRCRAPNDKDASICFRCQSALTLEKAIRIEEWEQKISRLDDLEKKVSQLEDQLILARTTGEIITPEEEQRFIMVYRNDMKRMSEKGWVVEE